jgi:hypothetical protein
MKTIATYQQSFYNASAAESATFNFSRIYKADPSHKIRITVSSLSYEALADGTEYTPPVFYLSGLSELTGKCISQRQDGLTKNDWALGTCGENSSTGSKSASIVSESPSLIVEELPLNPFRIYLEQYNASTYSSTFRVTFNIEVIDC